jgi:heat shock protein HslJ
MRTLFEIFKFLALASLLAACTSAPTSTPPEGGPGESPPLTELEGTHWSLVRLNGRELAPDTFISLEIAGGGISGNAGCNGYGGSFSSAEPGKLQLSEISSTAMACEPEIRMQQEGEFLQALQHATGYRLVEGQLELLDASGEVLLVFSSEETFQADPADLVGTSWILVSLDGQPPMEGSTITMEFLADNRMKGSAGCRNYQGNYQAETDSIHFPKISMVEMECQWPATFGVQEGDFTDVLTWANRYQLAEDRLEIYSSRGETLVFERTSDQAGR